MEISGLQCDVGLLARKFMPNSQQGVGALLTLNKPWSCQAERPNSAADDMISELRNCDNMGTGGDIS